jgi:hypothetical protein
MSKKGEGKGQSTRLFAILFFFPSGGGEEEGGEEIGEREKILRRREK